MEAAAEAQADRYRSNEQAQCERQKQDVGEAERQGTEAQRRKRQMDPRAFRGVIDFYLP